MPRRANPSRKRMKKILERAKEAERIHVSSSMGCRKLDVDVNEGYSLALCPTCGYTKAIDGVLYRQDA